MSSFVERLKYGARAWRRRTRKAESWTEWIYPYRALWLTREGWLFIGVTMAIGLAALNTGHNLFYLVFAMLVSMITASGVLSERAVKSLAVERIPPKEIFAGSPAAIELRIRNRHGKRTSYVIEVRDGLDGEVRRKIGTISRLEPGNARSFHSLWTFPRRGRVGFANPQLVTRFPFGLFEKIRIVPLEEELLVFPALEGGRAEAGLANPERGEPRRHRLGEETLSLRPFLEDDDPRRIHWKVSARVGELVVREAGQPLDRPVAVFLDTRGPAGDAFEKAIGRTAHLLHDVIESGGNAVLFTWNETFPCSGRDTFRRAMAFLADVQPDATDRGEGRFVRWRSEVMSGAGGVFVTAGTAPAVPAGSLLEVA